ncbi:MAG: carboxypeptidase-like regulatory domain-containing protein [Myxococcota bacterium]
MLTNLLMLLVAGCDVGPPVEDDGVTEPAEPVEPPGNPGSQIGGIDCDYDKLDVTVTDEGGQPVASHVVADFPDDDQLAVDCAASGCQLELSGPGTYALTVSAPGFLAATTDVVLDDADIVGRRSDECGGSPVYEDTITVWLAEGPGDILTSHLSVSAFGSDGLPTTGEATIDGPFEGPYTIECRFATSCWLDIEGPGAYLVDFENPLGETGRVSVTIDASHITGTNEVGETVYEHAMRIDLTP